MCVGKKRKTSGSCGKKKRGGGCTSDVCERGYVETEKVETFAMVIALMGIPRGHGCERYR